MDYFNKFINNKVKFPAYFKFNQRRKDILFKAQINKFQLIEPFNPKHEPFVNVKDNPKLPLNLTKLLGNKDSKQSAKPKPGALLPKKPSASLPEPKKPSALLDNYKRLVKHTAKTEHITQPY